jgi:hypothetical protein
MNNKIDLKYGIALWILLLCIGVFYTQGIASNFILDDISNIEAIKNIQPNTYWQDSLHFIFNGQAGPLGRPVSLFSFSLQSYAWPNAEIFKTINIFLHLLIGSLIFWFLLILGRLIKIKNNFLLPFCFISTTIWLLSPLQISTVLYVVQRMTQLSALFSLLSFITYLYGRQYFDQQQIKRGLVWMSLGLGFFGLLAIFSKENAVLIPLFILVIEFTLLQHLVKSRIWHYWASIFLYFPVGFIVFYLIFMVDPISGYINRPFSLGERLLTEPRVLLDYLRQLFLPSAYNFSLYQDDYIISTQLWQPISTFFSIVILISGIIFAFFVRRTYPIISFSILWFYAGHLLESSSIPLFIYFEHRNYLPILGPIIGSVYLLMRLYQNKCIKKTIRQFIPVLSIIWIFYIGFIYWGELKLWKNPLFQAIYWAEQNPQSRQAQSYAAAMLGQQGHIQKSLAYYQYMTKAFPKDITPHLIWLNLYCTHPFLPKPNMKKLQYQLRHGYDYNIVNILSVLESNSEKSMCNDLKPQGLTKMLLTLLNNPNLSGRKGGLNLLISFSLFKQKKLLESLNQLEKALLFKNLSNPIKAELMKLGLLMHLDKYLLAQQQLNKLKNILTLSEKILYQSGLDKAEKRILGHL